MPPAPDRPRLHDLFLAFAAVGLMSFGGGLAAWTRREVVDRKGWLDDRQFVSGYALSQLVPGATNINLAVFIGSQLRGLPGAWAAFWGLTTMPVVLMLLLGSAYFAARGVPGATWFSQALTGMGAVAIGMNLGLGVRLLRRNIRGAGAVAVVAGITAAIGVFGFRLPLVLALAMPTSLLIAWFGRAR